ncbi:hypothetical protein F442_03255 [Phytophthora nicotianae P10297]|uniref:Uncharacterized protein n=1 Tax=Phytophthora nicotianae P10297 TaxID=1317064 RepID=W2ZXG7_PHYNI|nr:hypothetical protein F442_03255 [Phytophthora nicotianae P10297]
MGLFTFSNRAWVAEAQKGPADTEVPKYGRGIRLLKHDLGDRCCGVGVVDALDAILYLAGSIRTSGGRAVYTIETARSLRDAALVQAQEAVETEGPIVLRAMNPARSGAVGTTTLATTSDAAG